MSALTPQQRGQLTIDAIDSLDMLADPDMSVADLAVLNEGLIDGLIQYVGYLEAALSITRACALIEVRDAGRYSARQLMTRPSEPDHG